MKKLLIVLLAIVIAIPVGAVLKERNLAHTLSVLRAELEHSELQQQENLKRYTALQERQHGELVDYMKRSEQIALMLYSQKQDFTFDIAYACQQATDLYRELNGRTLPYERIQERLHNEIVRYEGLIHSLQTLPPAVVVNEDGRILTKEQAEQEARKKKALEAEMQATMAFDSIDQQNAAKVDSIASELGVSDTTVQAVADSVKHLSDAYMLDENQQADRDTCLAIAMRIYAALIQSEESVNADNLYYKAVTEKVEGLNAYAQERYKQLQQSIFINAGDNYFTILGNLPHYINELSNAVSDKYVSFDTSHNSEWRGPVVKFVTIFVILWLFIAIIVSQLVLRICPKRWLPADFTHKRGLYYIVGGNLVFAISILVIHNVITQNFMVMATGLLTNIAWLALAIFLSILIRVDHKQTNACVKAYLPFIMLAFTVIAFRIMFVPNVLVKLLFPPILLGFSIWQLRAIRHKQGAVPPADVVYSGVSLAAMIISTILSWCGYVLLAVEIMVWWMFLLAAIQTITCIYDLLSIYEKKRVLDNVMKTIDKDADGTYDDDGTEIIESEVLDDMNDGVYITTTWIFDLINRAIVPILAVLSFAFSIWYAADIFEMTEALRSIFYYDFIKVDGFLCLSLHRIFNVVCCWFAFRYVGYILRSFYHHIKRTHTNLRPEQYNFTLVNNVIAILIWGSYILYVLFIFEVPKSGLSVVTAGLATGMGFAMKDLLENFFYGISLMTGRIRVGDYIECDGIQGRVDSITYQSTQLVAYDGSVIAFLNAQLFTKNFKNLTRNHHYELVKVPIGVAYGANIQEVRSILVERLSHFRRTLPDGRELLRPDSDISVVFADFGASSVDLLVCYWVLVDQKTAVAGQVKETIYDTLNEHNFEIPFPQCDVHMR